VYIEFNGEKKEIQSCGNLSELLLQLDIDKDRNGIAVALNSQVVPKNEWDAQSVQENDQIEVIKAVGGGVELAEEKSVTVKTDGLTIAGKTYRSRLLIGTSKYPNQQIMLDAIEKTGAEIVTIAIRRIDMKNQTGETVFDLLDRKKFTFLPNTAGCYTAKDAILTAQLAREALETDLIKLEVIGDDETLFPDVEQLLKAANDLVKAGFTVLPYCNDDPITCRKLADLGCPAVMPLGAPIGSGMGIRNPYNLQIIMETVKVLVIVDAGVGTASDVAVVMELGVDGVLMNTAVAGAKDPVKMALAMRLALESGRLAYEAGRIPKRLYANASSPLEGIIGT